MKKGKIFSAGVISLILVLMLALIGCPSDAAVSDSTVTISAITGITAPATGGTPVTAITETPQFTGTVSWNPPPAGAFAADTIYTATISLAATAGYTFDGVTANYFTVSGATAANAVNSGTVTAEFPKTAPPKVDFVSQTNDSTANDVTTLGLVGTSAVSGSETVAKADITGGKIKITSFGAGSATITVSDNSNHNATIRVSVAASGAITITSITKYESTNPLIGAWRAGKSTDFDELLIFTEGIAYYAHNITKQVDPIDKANKIIKLAVPGVNGGAAVDYPFEPNANNLVIKNSYFKDNDGKSLDVTFTRIEGSAKTDIDDVWYSWDQRTDSLYTLLVISDDTVYASFGMTGKSWDFDNDGDWVRASYTLQGVTAAGGTIHWTDGSDVNDNYRIDGNELTIRNGIYAESYTKQNL
jgi:hypothetical protein